jgi:hypothetical protein
MSTWTVNSQNAAQPRQTQPQGSAAADQPRPLGFRQAVVIKTGRIIDEQIVDGVGRKFEIWHVNGMEVSGASGESAPVITPDAAPKDIYTANFAISDFAGLDWISPQTYAGIQKVMGRDCILFRGKVNPQPAGIQTETKLSADRAALVAARAAYYTSNISASGGGQPAGATSPNGNLTTEVNAVACIDLETRLPVAVTFGQETRTYVFGQPPTAPLALPAAYATALSAYQRHITNLSRASAAP